MKRLVLLVLTVMLILSGCVTESVVPHYDIDEIETTTEECCSESETTTVVENTTELTTLPETTIPATAEPTTLGHSSLYIPGVSVEDVIIYFNEVVLDCEYYEADDPTKLQRWEEPVKFIVYGETTEKDREVIESLSQALNTIDGFPGIYEVQSESEANVRLNFLSRSGFVSELGYDFLQYDGYITFWYDYDVIYDMDIYIRTDIGQNVRNSVILEEFYNGLGAAQDTVLREDSIIYQEYAEPQGLTEIDYLILCLLYHPEMSCGMNAQECEDVIRRLYY